MKIVYAKNGVKVDASGVVHNPDYYDKPNKNAESVLIYGDYPKIKEDYVKLNIEVVDVNQEKPKVTRMAKPKTEKE